MSEIDRLTVANFWAKKNEITSWNARPTKRGGL